LLRAAVIIELLIRCPMRIGNLHSLRLDRHMRYLNGPRRPSHLQIEAHEVKNRQPLDFPLPHDTGSLIRRYIDEARPVLAEPGNPYLFPGMGQGPLSDDQVRLEFQTKVGGATGVAVHPHIMRAFAGLLFLERNPGKYEMLRRILGHARVETTISYYTGLEAALAHQAADAAILAERQRTRALALADLNGRGKGRPSRRAR
jgi:integrase